MDENSLKSRDSNALESVSTKRLSLTRTYAHAHETRLIRARFTGVDIRNLYKRIRDIRL